MLIYIQGAILFDANNYKIKANKFTKNKASIIYQ